MWLSLSWGHVSRMDKRLRGSVHWFHMSSCRYRLSTALGTRCCPTGRRWTCRLSWRTGFWSENLALMAQEQELLMRWQHPPQKRSRADIIVLASYAVVLNAVGPGRYWLAILYGLCAPWVWQDWAMSGGKCGSEHDPNDCAQWPWLSCFWFLVPISTIKWVICGEVLPWLCLGYSALTGSSRKNSLWSSGSEPGPTGLWYQRPICHLGLIWLMKISRASGSGKSVLAFGGVSWNGEARFGAQFLPINGGAEFHFPVSADVSWIPFSMLGLQCV